MASQPDILQECLREGVRASRSVLEHCLGHAIEALQAAEVKSMKVAERDELASAWRLLQANKASWLARYPADLQSALNHNAAAAERATKSGDLTPTQSLAPKPGIAPARGRNTGFGGLDAFSLVDDADVDQSIASSRLLQHILPRVEQELAELDTLISSAQGLANVRPELNPLRPDVFTHTLQDLLASAGPEPTVFNHWIRHLAEPLGRELKTVYNGIIVLLERANVQAAQYRVLQTPLGATGKGGRKGGAGPGGSGGASGDGSGGDGLDGEGLDGGRGEGRGGGAASQVKEPSQYADLSNFEIRDELFQDFLFHGGSNAHHGLAPSYYDTVEEELAALKAAPDSVAAPLGESLRDDLESEGRRTGGQRKSQRASPSQSQYQNMSAVDRPARFVDVLSQLSSQVWGAYGRSRERAIVRTQLKKEATKVGQVLGLEVVRKLVNQVAKDPRLLVPVREAIVALEPSLLRLAMVDPRFFSDEGHAGRRLMERVAQRSFKYNDEYSPEFAEFFNPVTSAFNELNGLDIEDARPFGMALAQLENGWGELDQVDLQRRRQVLQALQFAEERQETADQIAFDLSKRSDLDKVPGVVLDFLFGPWALAMAHARLSDRRNQVDPEGFGSVVPDLLWSVKREVTLKRPAKLIDMIPGLLARLHAGMGMLGQDPKESEPFFESLMNLHQPVLKLRRLKSRRDAEESGAMPLEALESEEVLSTPEQRRAKAAEQPWLGRGDLSAAGFEDTLPAAPADLAALEQQMEEEWRLKLAKVSASAEQEAVPPAKAGHALNRNPAAASALQAKAESAPTAETGDESAVAADAANALLAGTPAAPALPADAAAAAAAQEQASEIARAQAEASLMALMPGSWVDLYSKRRWLRAQLIWASTKCTLFMFLSHGGQPHSMTRRSCEKLIMQRLLRPVDTHGVVAQALDAVAQEVATPPLPGQQPIEPYHEPETIQ